MLEKTFFATRRLSRYLTALIVSVPFGAFAQTVPTPVLPAQYGPLINKTWVFIASEGGQQFIKSFTCGDKAVQWTTDTVLQCYAAPGEEYRVLYLPLSSGSAFSFLRVGAGGGVVANSYVYNISTLNAAPTLRLAWYYEIRDGEDGPPRDAILKTVTYSAENAGPALASWNTPPVPFPSDGCATAAFDGAAGTLTLPCVKVGQDRYSVMMDLIRGSSPFSFTLKSANKLPQ